MVNYLLLTAVQCNLVLIYCIRVLSRDSTRIFCNLNIQISNQNFMFTSIYSTLYFDLVRDFGQ